MDPIVFTAVIIASMFHATWNGMVKKHSNKVTALSAIILGHVPISIIAVIFLPMPSFDSLPYIIVSAFIHQGYNWFLLKSYSVGDLTKVYPIARGFGPIIATIISIFFLGLIISKASILSISLVCAGILIISLFGYKTINNLNIIKYSLITGFFIGLYTVIDGYGARVSLSAISYMSWGFILSAMLFPILLKINKYDNIFRNIINDGKAIFWIGGSISYLVYGVVIWGFTKAPIPMVSALRESSIVFVIFIGIFFLDEKINLAKIISIILIFFGVIGLKIF
ncbi:DMT family transporter [Candidatus Pelagibacter ubique]|jgi:drug/metabolite transporter (DMT)-like permease|nr:EamA family transporter [Candidatus Pelagibacter sp.]MDA7443550.1 DMT family transporter [Candidatus Pelagibacter ubique]MDA9996198.1 DMT family transporter [Candidatus Pelagibacter sp.]MDB9768839.1 DMT family transporter [Candidatus Pelagibacter ubique]MDC0516405.1 DMT family transporter [Candidatus Pelagibacter sp.]